METFGDAFEFDIHNMMIEGDLARLELFEWWLRKKPTFTCERCQKEFSPGHDVEEEDKIFCPRCLKGARL